MEWTFEEGLIQIRYQDNQNRQIYLLLQQIDYITLCWHYDSLPTRNEYLHDLNYYIEDVGNLTDYLGVQVKNLKYRFIELTQPQLIDNIIKDLDFKKNTKPTRTLAISRKIHNKDFSGNWHDETKFKSCSVIGKLNFIDKSTGAYIAYSMHQCACLSEDPRQSHNKSINNFVRYVVHTKDKGLILEPKYHSFECWADTDFVRNWFK